MLGYAATAVSYGNQNGRKDKPAEQVPIWNSHLRVYSILQNNNIKLVISPMMLIIPYDIIPMTSYNNIIFPINSYDVNSYDENHSISMMYPKKKLIFPSSNFG